MLILRGVDFQDENSGVLVVFSWDLVLGISLEMRKSMLTKEGWGPPEPIHKKHAIYFSMHLESCQTRVWQRIR